MLRTSLSGLNLFLYWIPSHSLWKFKRDIPKTDETSRMTNLVRVRYRWYTYESNTGKIWREIALLSRYALYTNICRLFRCFASKQPVKQTVEVVVMKDAELISWINKQNKISPFSPWGFFVIVPALVAIKWQCWLESTVLVCVLMDYNFFPWNTAPYWYK